MLQTRKKEPGKKRTKGVALRSFTHHGTSSKKTSVGDPSHKKFGKKGGKTKGCRDVEIQVLDEFADPGQRRGDRRLTKEKG